MSMILPQANLKAKDLLRDLLPDKRLLKAYKDVGKEDDYDRSCHERAYVQFHTLITSNHPQVLNQEVEQKISNLMRVKDSKGEWLVYGVLLVAKDWKGNKHDFFHTEGKISNGSVDGLPVFNNEVDPNTNEIIPRYNSAFGTQASLHHSFHKRKSKGVKPLFHRAT
jgi:hypothetical protein